MKSNLKIWQRLTLVGLIGLLAFASIGLWPIAVRAQGVVSAPILEALGITAETKRTLKGISTAILKRLTSLAWKGVVVTTLKQLAYDTAVWQGTGGTGQKPLFQQKGWSKYLEDTAGGAALDAINNLLSDAGFEGLNVCNPSSLPLKLNIVLGITGAQAPEKPKCTWSQVKENWANATQNADWFKNFSLSLDPSQQDIGIALTVFQQIGNVKSHAEASATLERGVRTGDLTPERTKVTGDVIIPQEDVKEKAKEPKALATSYFGVTPSDLLDVATLFASTFIQKRFDREKQTFYRKLADLQAGEGDTSSAFNKLKQDLRSQQQGLFSDLGGSNRGERTARLAFKPLTQLEFKTPGRFDAAVTLTDCSSTHQDENGIEYPLANRCAITESFVEAMRDHLSVSEAINATPSKLSGGAKFGFDPEQQKELVVADGDLPYRSLVILRKYRVIPVTWELAAQYANQYSKKIMTLQELQDCYEDTVKPGNPHYPKGCREDTNNDGSTDVTSDPASYNPSKDLNPFYHLVDPNWVLKLPETYCKRQGPGPETTSPSIPSCDVDNSAPFNGPNCTTQKVCTGTPAAATVGNPCSKNSDCQDGTCSEISENVPKWVCVNGDQQGLDCTSDLDCINNGKCVEFRPDQARRIVQRNDDYCADEQSCIAEDASGSCLFYGYCAQEQSGWRFPGQQCPAYFSSCQQLTRTSDGQSAAYLLDTLGRCDSSQVGCRWYSTGQDTNGLWNPDSEKLYLNRAGAQSQCTAKDAGCTEYLRIYPGVNLTYNGDFRLAPGNVPEAWNSAGDGYSASGGHSGAGVISAGNQFDVRQDIVLQPSTRYILSAWAKSEGGAKARLALALRDSSDRVDNSSVARATVTNCTTNDGGHPNFLTIYGSTGDGTYQRISCSFTADQFTRGGRLYLMNTCSDADCTGKLTTWDEVQVEVQPTADQPSDYLPFRTGNQAYLTAAAPACTAEEAGCTLYTPGNGDSAVPGVAGSGDSCPTECAGFSTFVEQPTALDPNSRSVNLIPSTAQVCSLAEVGCEEFTSLAQAGGERLAYYSQVRACVEDTNQNVQAYYTWEGSDTTGYQLKTWDLLKSNLNESSGQPAPCTNVNDSRACADTSATVASCSAADLGTNLDCREFLDRAGNKFYRLQSRTVSASAECVPLRRTNDQQTYYVIPSEGRACTAQAKDCRLYRGNAGSNVRVIQGLEGQFEIGSVGDWVSQYGVRLSNESVQQGGHSLLIRRTFSGESLTVLLPLPFAPRDPGGIQSNQNYQLQLWAKRVPVVSGDESSPPGTDYSSGLHSYDLQFSFSPTSEWQQYTLGPLRTGASLANILLRLTVNGVVSGQVVVIDQVVLKEFSDSVALISDSWRTPASCLTVDPASGSNALGCQLYTPSTPAAPSGSATALKSFSRLCRSEAVGCEAMIDTRNSTTPLAQTFNSPSPDPSEQDDVTVSADALVYQVNDPQYSCQAQAKGCQALGLPELDAVTGEVIEQGGQPVFSTLYLRNDPDAYAANLCDVDGLSCEEYQAPGPDGSRRLYRKDPGNKTCRYFRQELVDTADGTGPTVRTGWYSDRKVCLQVNDGQTLGQPCQTQSDCGSAGKCGQRACPAAVGIASGALASYNPNTSGWQVNWAGQCDVDQSSCAEYRDPEELRNKVLIVERRCLAGDPLKRYDLCSADSDCGAGAPSGSCGKITACDSTLPDDSDPNTPNCRSYYYKGDSLQQAGAECNGAVDRLAGCRLFLDTSDQVSATGLPTRLFQSSQSQDRSAPSPCPDPVSPGLGCDSNVILKVVKDRQCSQWLSCLTAVEEIQPDQQVGRSYCYQVGLCDQIDPKSGICTRFIQGKTCKAGTANQGLLCQSDSDCGANPQLGDCQAANQAGYQVPEYTVTANRVDQIANLSGYATAGLRWSTSQQIPGRFLASDMVQTVKSQTPGFPDVGRDGLEGFEALTVGPLSSQGNWRAGHGTLGSKTRVLVEQNSGGTDKVVKLERDPNVNKNMDYPGVCNEEICDLYYYIDANKDNTPDQVCTFDTPNPGCNFNSSAVECRILDSDFNDTGQMLKQCQGGRFDTMVCTSDSQCDDGITTPRPTCAQTATCDNLTLDNQCKRLPGSYGYCTQPSGIRGTRQCTSETSCIRDNNCVGYGNFCANNGASCSNDANCQQQGYCRRGSNFVPGEQSVLPKSLSPFRMAADGQLDQPLFYAAGETNGNSNTPPPPPPPPPPSTLECSSGSTYNAQCSTTVGAPCGPHYQCQFRTGSCLLNQGQSCSSDAACPDDTSGRCSLQDGLPAENSACKNVVNTSVAVGQPLPSAYPNKVMWTALAYQIDQNSISLKPGQPYVVSFRYKGSISSPLEVWLGVSAGYLTRGYPGIPTPLVGRIPAGVYPTWRTFSGGFNYPQGLQDVISDQWKVCADGTRKNQRCQNGTPDCPLSGGGYSTCAAPASDKLPRQNQLAFVLNYATVDGDGDQLWMDDVSFTDGLQMSASGAVAGPSCRLWPKPGSLSCEALRDRPGDAGADAFPGDESAGDQTAGWKGYCLQYDPQDPAICLQWWPVDQIGRESLSTLAGGEVVGYDQLGKPAPVYYCLEATGKLTDIIGTGARYFCLQDYNNDGTCELIAKATQPLPLLFSVDYQSGLSKFLGTTIAPSGIQSCISNGSKWPIGINYHFVSDNNTNDYTTNLGVLNQYYGEIVTYHYRANEANWWCDDNNYSAYSCNTASNRTWSGWNELDKKDWGPTDLNKDGDHDDNGEDLNCGIAENEDYIFCTAPSCRIGRTDPADTLDENRALGKGAYELHENVSGEFSYTGGDTKFCSKIAQVVGVPSASQYEWAKLTKISLGQTLSSRNYEDAQYPFGAIEQSSGSVGLQNGWPVPLQTCSNDSTEEYTPMNVNGSCASGSSPTLTDPIWRVVNVVPQADVQQLYGRSLGVWTWGTTSYTSQPNSSFGLPPIVPNWDVTDDNSSKVPTISGIEVNNKGITGNGKYQIRAAQGLLTLRFNSNANDDQQPVEFLEVRWGDGDRTFVQGPLNDRPNQDKHRLSHFYEGQVGGSCLQVRVRLKDHWGWCTGSIYNCTPADDRGWVDVAQVSFEPGQAIGCQ